MLCVATLRLAVEHAAVRVLPLPVNATAEHPVIDVPPSVKLALPVGATPVTDAVNVTLAPDNDGFAELATVVVVGAGPPDLPTCATSALAQGNSPAAPRQLAAVLGVARVGLAVRP